MDSAFLQIGTVIIVAAACGIVARLLRQPLLLAYICAGVLLGAGGLHVIDNITITQDVASIGIIFLLFLVGLELDFQKVKELGPVILVTGLVQMAIVIAAGYALSQALGYPTGASWYFGLAAAFSSTAVVLKRLADRRELSALYARVTVGILLMQDIVAIVALMIISGIGAGGGGPEMALGFILRGTLLLVGTWVLARYVLSALFYHIAKSTELLFLTSIAWAFCYALAAQALGFSMEIGAFLAGLSLASLPYNLEIIGRVRPLKDFFLIIFFVVLGLEVSFPTIASNLPLIIGMTVLVLGVKSFVTSATMVRMGYPKRPAYLTGAGLGQMSEFSLLVALLGLSYGHLSQEMVALIATMTVITITLNTYWNSLNRMIYPILAKPLSVIGSHVKQQELTQHVHGMQNHILLFGANRVGYQLLQTLERLKKDVLVVDHNPDIIRKLQHRGVTSVYGDIDDLELLEQTGVQKADMVISTVPNPSASMYLIEQTRATNKKALIITTAEQVDEALAMYAAGADYVILPRIVGGEAAAKMLENLENHTLDKDSIGHERQNHIESLIARKQELPV